MTIWGENFKFSVNVYVSTVSTADAASKSTIAVFSWDRGQTKPKRWMNIKHYSIICSA